MDQNSIDRLRSADFPLARKGYDPAAVDELLGKLVDWLETGGGDRARAEVIKRELQRIGEKTAAILTSAEDAAERLRADAEREADETVGQAHSEATRSREEADAYAGQVRSEADEYAAGQRGEADAYAEETRSAADRYAETTRSSADADAERRLTSSEQRARETLEAAEAKAERIVSEGVRRRREIEAVIADLVSGRNEVIADTQRLSAELGQLAATHKPEQADRFAPPAELDPEEAASSDGAAEEPAAARRAQVS